jgi:glycosyltransferase involved in cell wall biosynthesis
VALTLAYVTGQYGRPTDTFMRDEVAALREVGHTVHTFSIRHPPEPPVDAAVSAERATTDYVLTHGLARLAGEAGALAVRRPVRLGRAAALATRITWPGLRGRLWPAAYLVEAAYMARRLEALGVQHLHDHITEGSAAVAMLASALSGIPFSMTAHGIGEVDRAPILALDEKVARASFVTAVSQYMRAQIVRWARPEHWDKIRVVRCGVPRHLLEREPTTPPDTHRLVAVGRIEEEKGHLSLVEAAARVREPLEVVIVGDGPLRPAVEDRIRALGAGNRVRLAGRLPHAELIEVVADSRALVQPSFAEGMGVSIMEAFALGRPVIGTRVGGIPELVEPGGTGWLVAPGEPAELARAMTEVLATPVDELGRLGLAGRERVVANHDGAKEAAQLAALFEASVRGELTAPSGKTG